MTYEPLVVRTKRVLISSALGLDGSKELSSISQKTHIPNRTLLFASLASFCFIFIITPKHTTNLLCILLPLSKTIEALDGGDGVEAREARKRWWDYWMLLCTSFLLELFGLTNLLGGYWGWKLVLALWLSADGVDDVGSAGSLEENARSARATTSQDESTQTDGHLADDVFPVTAEPAVTSKSALIEPASPSSIYSVEREEQPLLETPELYQEPPTTEQPRRFPSPDRGVATTLDDLLELEFEAYSDASHDAECVLREWTELTTSAPLMRSSRPTLSS